MAAPELPPQRSEDGEHLGIIQDIAVELLDASDDIKEFFRQFNAGAGRLQALKQRSIDPRTDPPMPKDVWKLRGVLQSVIYRSVELHNAISTLVNNGNLLASIVVARTLVELMVFLSDLHYRLAGAIRAADLPSIDAAIMSTNFATRWDSMPEETRAKNILTVISRFDKNFMGEKEKTPTADVHAALSEYTHPNWVGMAGFFSTTDCETFVQYFSVQHREKARLYDTLVAGCMCLALIEHILRHTIDFDTEVWQISERLQA